ncbi:scavenger receptor cysteine-rich type 1 protein M130-like isoform X2 [Dysidea avara]|uniref:scavenger receptor cysteine-rich type 1 protein M130-like isoform X2 n=1 Tax=Dysidea avara TaxID=196820 RepID=UPI00332072CC
MKLANLLLLNLLAYLTVTKSKALPSTGDLRLTGYGATSLWGRLEIYHDGIWGTICDEQFTINEAEVACRQMGLGYSVNVRTKPLQRHGLADSTVHFIFSCNGSESHLLNCEQIQITNTSHCSHKDDVEIICSGFKPLPYSGEVRLVGGTFLSEGQVEIYLNGQWGRVCSENISSVEANVICRHLGYDSAVSWDVGSNYSSLNNISVPEIGSSIVWVNDVMCNGSEVCLGSCLSSIPSSPLELCSNEVRVRCSHSSQSFPSVGNKSLCEVNSTYADKSLRLVGGDTPSRGRLEILHNNTWGVICSDGFGAAEGHIACKQIGYSVIFNFINITIQDNPAVNFYGVKCGGTESSLSECIFNSSSPIGCPSDHYVALRCYERPFPPLATVRMLGGSGPFGVIEIFNGGAWGPICDEYFDLVDGDVVCRQLGFTGAVSIIHNSYLGLSSSYIHITNISCAGNETHLWDCPSSNSSEIKCTEFDQVAVHCGNNASMQYGSLRLTNSISNNAGRLEINLDGTWGSVCLRDFGMLDGHVACRQLGFRGVINVTAVSESTGANHTVFLTEVFCKGYENSLINCDHEFGDNICDHNEDVYLTCDTGPPELDGRLRLVDGETSNSGRLEIFKSGLWGTVCSTHFDKVDADVACRQLQYSGSTEILKNFGGGSSLPINLHEINCQGNETMLINCDYEVYAFFYCQHSENVAITCNDTAIKADNQLRLADGTANNGRLDVTVNGLWGKVCSENFDKPVADVACRQLGLNESLRIITNFVGLNDNLPVYTFDTRCTGSEDRLADCITIINNSTCSSGYIAITCNVYCPALRDPDNGVVTCKVGYDGLPSFQDTCDVTCDTGYVVNGSKTRMCMGSKTWSGDGTCNRVMCPSQPVVPNGSVSCSLGDDGVTSYEDTCSLQCDVGYELMGSNTLMCHANGTWSNFSVCIRVKCPTLEDLGNGYVTCSLGDDEVFSYGDTCSYTCGDGYKLTGSSIAACGSDGQWNMSSILECTKVLVPGNFSNGDLRLSGYGSTSLWGRLEIYLNGKWGTICDNNINIEAVEVACHQMGLGYAVNYRSSPYQRHGISINGIHLAIDHCNGNESHLLNCRYSVNFTCSHLEVVEAICSEWKPFPYQGEVRLSDGKTVSEGILEIFLNGRWGKLCSPTFDQREGLAVCRQLGYSSFEAFSSNALYTGSSDAAWSTSVSCTSDQACISKCIAEPPTLTQACQPDQYISIKCGHGLGGEFVVGDKSTCEIDASTLEGSVRLYGSPSSGILQIYQNGTWGTVCNNDFNAAEGHVACRQLGYSVLHRSIRTTNETLLGTFPMHYSSIQCIGTEDTLSECLLSTDFVDSSCMADDVLTVVSIECYEEPYPPLGSIRLVGGSGPFGILEIFNGGYWGAICDTHFNLIDASIACKQLGYSDAISVIPNSYYGVSLQRVHMSDFQCNGHEKYLLDCPYVVSRDTFCSSLFDQVAVHCGTNSTMRYGALRLEDGNSSAGRLEILIDGIWGTVCDFRFDMRDAHVACRELGYSGVLQVAEKSSYGMGTGPIHIYNLQCEGFEDDLIDCDHDPAQFAVCNHKDDVGIVCDLSDPVPDGELRLSDGSVTDDAVTGRLEILLNGLWGTVCSRDFNLVDATVACNQLGYDNATRIFNYGGGQDLPINFYTIQCYGNESKLITCQYEIYPTFYCSHLLDVGITCIRTRTTPPSSTGTPPLSTGSIAPTPTSQPATSEDVDVGKLVSIVAFVMIIFISLVVVVIVIVVGCVIRRRGRNQMAHQKFHNETEATYSSQGPTVSVGAFDNAIYGTD